MDKTQPAPLPAIKSKTATDRRLVEIEDQIREKTRKQVQLESVRDSGGGSQAAVDRDTAARALIDGEALPVRPSISAEIEALQGEIAVLKRAAELLHKRVFEEQPSHFVLGRPIEPLIGKRQFAFQ